MLRKLVAIMVLTKRSAASGDENAFSKRKGTRVARQYVVAQAARLSLVSAHTVT